MANQLDAIGNDAASLPDLIDAAQVAALCGRKTPGFTHMKIRDDRSFPRPLNGRTGAGGPRMLWRRSEILQWIEQKENGKKEQAQPAVTERLHIDTALKFISGHFDAPHAQKACLRRIERARKNNIKNQKRIRIEGDWK